MSSDPYHKRNGSWIEGMYPVKGKMNILRKVGGRKLRSFTGPSGQGFTVRQPNGQIRSMSVSKWVAL